MVVRESIACDHYFFCSRKRESEDVGSRLIDIVVEPIAEEEVGMSAPADYGSASGVVIWEIAFGDTDGETLVDVAEILILESVAVILRMPHDEDLTAVRRRDEIWSGDRRIDQEFEIRVGINVLAAGSSVA